MTRRQILIGLLAVGACGSPRAGPGHVPTLRIQEETRIGSLEGEGSSLHSVVGVAVDDSAVFVLESDPPRVALFNTMGRWIKDVAAAGDGPGELRRPTLIGVLRDTLWVGDPTGGRLETYTEQGTPLRSYRWDVRPDSSGVGAFPSALLADGSLLAGPGGLGLSGPVSGHVTHQSYYRVSPDGEVLGTLYRRVLEPSDFVSAKLPNGGRAIGVHPMRESPLVTVYPDGSGLVAVERPVAESRSGATYRLLVVRPDGTTGCDVRVPYTPVSASGWKERRLREMEAFMRESTGTVDRDLMASLGDAWADRAFYPPVSEVVGGADGTIWIRREDTGADSVSWQVFNERCRLVGTLRSEAILEVRWASLDELWGVERNDLDVPFVVGMRVE